jgi:hypothetical protein
MDLSENFLFGGMNESGEFGGLTFGKSVGGL